MDCLVVNEVRILNCVRVSSGSKEALLGTCWYVIARTMDGCPRFLGLRKSAVACYKRAFMLLKHKGAARWGTVALRMASLLEKERTGRLDWINAYAWYNLAFTGLSIARSNEGAARSIDPAAAKAGLVRVSYKLNCFV